MDPDDLCPCGSGRSYASCCGPVHARTRLAATPEELMRSRYSAFALGLEDHLLATWHPRTRPADVAPDPALRWTGLVVQAAAGAPDDTTGTVEFTASYVSPDGPGAMHEVSRFERRGGRWFYLDGEVS
ncbi:YchJ family protein [Aeromicrobium sp. IC_218]|uniref:YchJ family protein n=1 Tax=Aeromicrobium sp. IC_218 TaxID=2545468 RepID=UPI001040A40D|nr:YchJ family protein [Aeromicrobium sp. IC_218]TCI97780.1 zinc chelation protein SecC [Aeromicrobium sp. IC_218]